MFAEFSYVIKEQIILVVFIRRFKNPTQLSFTLYLLLGNWKCVAPNTVITEIAQN